ncbi:hypothetical protein vseg_005480 [Gypsophila vaccaria]
MNGVTESFKILNKSDPPQHSFWNKPQTNLKKKRFGSASETFLLGPGSGAGLGCGVGFGFGLVGGAGYSGWGWNHIRLAFGFGAGCGIGVGFGYGHGFGYGSGWESIKSDVLGFKKKKGPRNRVVTYI